METAARLPRREFVLRYSYLSDPYPSVEAARDRLRADQRAAWGASQTPRHTALVVDLIQVSLAAEGRKRVTVLDTGVIVVRNGLTRLDLLD